MPRLQEFEPFTGDVAARPATPSSTPAVEEDGSVFAALEPLIAHWRTTVGIPAAFILLAVVFTFVVPRRYTASASFTPSAGGSEALSGSLASLAGQFGISLDGSGGASPDFFAEVLRSREIFRETLAASFTDPKSGAKRPLLEILAVPGDTPEEKMFEGVKVLDKRTLATVDKRTGIITFTVTARDPRLAADIANTMLEEINRFNLERMQTQSRERRVFIGDRLDEAQRQLAAAEEEQVDFLRGNRSYTASPILEAQASRLQRHVDERQEVVSTLRREFEQAKIAEVRDTPVITVIDHAIPPTRKSFPSLTLDVIVAAVLGSVIAMIVAYARAMRDRARTSESPAYEQFRLSLVRARSDLRRILRRERLRSQPQDR